ncbi:MAG: Holliday junction branch migration protein RuvA [Bacteroidetes bacterium]|nr:Holliday junction branch migration protein RuvA [Bacteroidota bacterium]
MLNHIEGNLVEKTPTYAVIDCNGLGYLLNISLNTYSKMAASGTCKLYAEEMYVRDDLPKLFGFADMQERQLFRHLVSVSGVGGTSAIMMLSSLSAREIQQAILTGNVTLLKSIKGIGEKTAQRIIVDLKGKLGKSELSSDFMIVAHNNNRDEALSALVNLGFAKNVTEKALDKVINSSSSELNVEDLIKAALKNL